MHTCGISLLAYMHKATAHRLRKSGLPNDVAQPFAAAYKQKATAHRLRKSGLSNDIAQPMGSRLCV